MKPSFAKQNHAYLAGRLLNLKMPDGRKLSDWTAADCDAAGGWLKAVGRRIRRGWADAGDGFYDSKTVGETFDEAALGLSFLMSHALQLAYWWLLERSGPDKVQPGDEFDGDTYDAEAFRWKK